MPPLHHSLVDVVCLYYFDTDSIRSRIYRREALQLALLHYREGQSYLTFLTELFNNLLGLKIYFKAYIFLHGFSTFANRSKYV